jgi:hypothetical protein
LVRKFSTFASKLSSIGFNCGSAAMVSRRSIHASAVLAPNASAMMPTGTLICRCKSRAKKYPTAQNAGAVCGVQTCHSPVTHICGCKPCRHCREHADERIIGGGDFRSAFVTPAKYFALPMESSALSDMEKSMFDWPDASHTSPTSTSSSAMGCAVFEPVTVSVRLSADAFIGFEIHAPFAVRIGGGGNFLAGKFHGHNLARVRRAPDRHLHVALQNHVAGERAGELHLGARLRREQAGAQRKNGAMETHNCFHQ